MTIEQIAMRPFSLLRSFSILSLVTIIVITTVSAALLSEFMRKNLLQRDAVVTKEFVQSVAQTQNIIAYFAEKDYSKSTAPLELFFKQISNMPDVRRANVFAKDGTVIWSSQAQLIGTRYGQNQELEQALRGEVVVEIEQEQSREGEKLEHVLFPVGTKEYIENYIPIYDPMGLMTIEQIAMRPFSLLRSFSILSLVTIIVITTVSAALLSEFMRKNLLQRDAVVTKEFVQSVAQTQNIIAYFAEKDYSKSTAPLELFFKQISNMPDVRRANVFAKDGTVIWSSQAQLIGTRYGQNQELEQALRGEVVVEIEQEQSREGEKLEHVLFPVGTKEYIENYIPIYDPMGQIVIGAVEVYKVPRVLFETIRSGRRLIWISAAVGGLFLYLVLFWIVWRTSLVIKRQQDTLLQKEKLAVVGEMASAVAHGLRNPLSSIRSSAELAIEEEDETTRDGLKDIIHEVDRLDKWIRELLTFQQTVPTEARAISIKSVICNSLAGFKTGIAQDNVAIDVDVPDTLPLVKGDENLLIQAVNNLITNALESMPNGGDLKVEAEANGTYVKVKIVDTGVGLQEDFMEDAFTPFVTHKKNGMGIGLHISRRIFERFGGSLDLVRNDGLGTTALISLLIGR